MLHRMGEEKLHFRINIVKQKLANAGHVLRASSGFNALLVIEGESEVWREEDKRPTQKNMDRWRYTVDAEETV